MQLHVNGLLANTIAQDQFVKANVAESWSDQVKKVSDGVKDPLSSVKKMGSKMTGLLFYSKAEEDEDSEQPPGQALSGPSAQSSGSSQSDLYLQLKSQKFKYEADYLIACLPAIQKIEKQFHQLLEIYEQEGAKFEKLSLEFQKFHELNENCNKATRPLKQKHG